MHSLHPKLYDHCYTLHPRVSFTVKLDGNMSTWLAYVYCLSDTNLKDQKPTLPNQLKKI